MKKSCLQYQNIVSLFFKPLPVMHTVINATTPRIYFPLEMRYGFPRPEKINARSEKFTRAFSSILFIKEYVAQYFK